MAADHPPEEAKLSDRGMVTIPAALRRRLDNKLRWDIDEEGGLSVEVVKQRHGALDDFEPVSMGGDSGETHDAGGYEDDSDFSDTT